MSPSKSAVFVFFCFFGLLAGKLAAADPVAEDGVAHHFSNEARVQLRKHLLDSVRSGEVPGGALLLMHDDSTIFREGFGFSHLKRQQPFTADSPFRAASISKSIIATLVVKLAAEGTLDLDKPIGEYLPVMAELRLESGQPMSHQPTLREALKHTAGFCADTDPNGRPWLELAHQGFTLAEVVDRLAAMPLRSNPGEQFAYSGIGYDIAGRIIEVTTGRILDQVLREDLCEPLGMTETTYYPDARVRKQMPSFYWRWRSDGQFRRKLEKAPIESAQYTSVGGGIVTTLDDLACFLQLHQHKGRHEGKQIIPAAALDAMYQRKRPGSYYGLGFMLGPADATGLATEIFHTGSSGTLIWLQRNKRVIGVLATQHRFSDGEQMPESMKVISKDVPAWPLKTKQTHIDPLLQSADG